MWFFSSFKSQNKFKQFNIYILYRKYIDIYAKNGYGDAFGLPTLLSEMKLYIGIPCSIMHLSIFRWKDCIV